MKRYSLYLSEQELEKMKAIAKARKTSLNSLIRQRILVRTNYWDDVSTLEKKENKK